MPKSKAEEFKEAIMAAVEDETEHEAIDDAVKAAANIYVDQRLVRTEELSTLVEKALDGSEKSFRFTFDDASNLYLSTSDGILKATVSK